MIVAYCYYMRLDKLLADMNVGTRKEIKNKIRNGSVSVGGAIVRDPGTPVTGAEAILCDGAIVRYQAFSYYMMNKPAGVISASEDPRQKTVLDLMDDNRRRDLFPVGRLDKDTVGLLLITNDGELAHRLLSPKSHVDKVYYARVTGEVTADDIAAFAEGLVVDASLTALPAELSLLQYHPSEKERCSEVRVTIREGKFHQIKRMFAAIGKEVLYLKRLSMGPLTLDPALEEGCCRHLTAEEIQLLRSR